MSTRIGRPMKYDKLIFALDDNALYSPAGVAINAENLGILNTNIPQEEVVDRRRRIRHSMNRYRINHNFPEDGDGIVRLEGQGVSKAWYGHRWKSRLRALGEAPGEVVTVNNPE